jgi:hypothetical protein
MEETLMPMPARVAKEPELPRNVRMTLRRDEYISEYKPYRFRAGTVILVDEETAQRWRQNDVAVDSAETDKTAAELKKAQIAALQQQIVDLESGEAVGDLGVTPEIAARAVKRR